MGDSQVLLRAALVAAHRAGEIQRRTYRRSGLALEHKADGSPVTVVDRHCEETIRDTLRRATPELGFLGEESGAEGSTVDRWVVDPLDGTKNFVAGLPLFAVLIALEIGGERRLGVIHAPELGETWWAVRGGGAFARTNGGALIDPALPGARRLRVSDCADPARALLVCGELGLFTTGGRWPGFGSLVERVGQARGYGDFWGHVLVAEGRAELMIDPQVAYHDVAALEVLIHESGGTWGMPPGERLAAGYQGAVVSSNRALAPLAAQALQGPAPPFVTAWAELELHDSLA